ncbi:MAG: hypothetical protein FJZ43_01805 [Candidatus Staskawiczbacteria bacterium]|nr:hypothetical protein [Candidatus Staskawiczbacteria bacterium]
MKFSNKLLLAFIFSVLISIPFFWNMKIGGDDGKFYYLFPFEFLTNFSLENIFNDLGSFNPAQFFVPFSFIILVLKKIIFFLNIQSLLFGLNLGFSFLFFYLFLEVITDKERSNESNFQEKIIASLFYSLSIFSYYTLWNSQLTSVYLISIFPLILFFFFKSVKEKKIIYSVFGCLVLSLFSIFILSIPWFLALLIVILPFFFNLFLKNKKIFTKYLLISLALLFMLNLYWTVNFFLSIQSSSINSVLTNISDDFKQENNLLINAVSSKNSVLYPIFSLFHKDIQIDYNWSTKDIYLSYLAKLLPINFIFLFIIIIPTLFYKKEDEQTQFLYNISIISWLLAIFLFTANIGKWGIPLFAWLSNNIPIFFIFRNMYDKFGLALAFSWSILIFVSLKIIFGRIKITGIFKNIITLIILAVILINSFPFISGSFFKLPIHSTKNTYPSISDFNDEFYKLSDYIKNIKTTSKFLWLPLNNAGYTVISDKKTNNNYYIGISPIKTLTGKNDYSGFLNFNSFSGKIQKLVANREYENLLNSISKLNIEYVILNNDINNDLRESYLYGYNKKADLYDNQINSELLEKILGEKIKDFGNTYSLYKIKDQYLSKTVESDDIYFKKISSTHYEVLVKNLSKNQKISLLSNYSNFWKIYINKNPSDFECGDRNYYLNSNGKEIVECHNINSYNPVSFAYLFKKPVFDDSHKIEYDYANQWVLNPNYIKSNFSKDYYNENGNSSIDVVLTLYFKPQIYFYIGTIISIVTLIGCLIFLIILYKKREYIKKP